MSSITTPSQNNNIGSSSTNNSSTSTNNNNHNNNDKEESAVPCSNIDGDNTVSGIVNNQVTVNLVKDNIETQLLATNNNPSNAMDELLGYTQGTSASTSPHTPIPVNNTNYDDESVEQLMARASALMAINQHQINQRRINRRQRYQHVDCHSNIVEIEDSPEISNNSTLPNSQSAIAAILVDVDDITASVNNVIINNSSNNEESDSIIEIRNIRNGSPILVLSDEDDDVIFVGQTAAASVIDLSETITLPRVVSPVIAPVAQQMEESATTSAALAVATEAVSRSEQTNQKQVNCPICFEQLLDNRPFATSCGHVFCESCIKKAVKLSKKCPMCNRKLNLKQMRPIYF